MEKGNLDRMCLLSEYEFIFERKNLPPLPFGKGFSKNFNLNKGYFGMGIATASSPYICSLNFKEGEGINSPSPRLFHFSSTD